MGSYEGVIKVAARRLGLSVEDYQARRAEGLKHCTKCEAWKPTNQFDLDKSRGDGLKAMCIACTRVAVRKPHILQPPSTTERNRASEAVRQAIKQGRLAAVSAVPCFDCGGAAIDYHHHLGYARRHWLDVIALCRSCHKSRHFG